MCDFGDGGGDGDIISAGDGFDVFEIFGPHRDSFLLRICLAVGMALLFICLVMPIGYIIFPEWIQNLFESVFDCGILVYVALVVVLIGIIVTALYFVLRFLKRLYREMI